MDGKDESLYRRVQDRVRIFNKRLLNPFTMRFAGRPFAPYGIVRHVGRRSGRTYDTPVLVGTVDDRFVVPLPYGTDVDWCRNVLAAGNCTVVWQGSAYRAEDPRLIDPADGGAAFPDWQERLIRTAGAERYLLMDRGEEVPETYREVVGAHPAAPAAAVLVGLAAVAILLRRATRRAGAGDRE